jgi:integrase/recombinase XerD
VADCKEAEGSLVTIQENSHRVCASRRAKNLIVANGTRTTGDISKNKHFEFAWYLKKEGKSESTILTYGKLLSILEKRGATLNDPESVKGAIAEQQWVNKRKGNAVNAYTHYLAMNKRVWTPPYYK